MHKMKNILSKEVKIALTAITAVVLLYLLISFMKGVNVFKATNTYYVEFADIQGLAVSNAVYAGGYPVGIVRTIDYDYARKDRVIVGIELDKEMQVPVGTRAELESSLMGGVSMHLILGPNPTRHISRGDTIQGAIHKGALAQAEALVPTVVSMAPKIDTIMTNLAQLTGDPALQQTLHNFAATSLYIRQASQKLDAVLAQNVPEMMTRLQGASKNLETLSGNLAQVDVQKTLDEVNGTLAEVKQFSTQLKDMSTDLSNKLNGTDSSLGLLLNTRDLYDNINTSVVNLNHTIQSADTLVTDLKQHPKRYVHFSVFGKKDK